MLLSPRTYQLAQTPDRGTTEAVSPFLKWTPSWKDKLDAERKARRMLLVHQAGSVKVGEVIRYTLTYTPAEDRILPSPSHLHVKIKNSSAIPLRAAYLHGPYTLHVAAYPSTFNPNHKVEDPKKEGIPEFEPNLKAGGSFTTRLVVPEEIREHGGATSVTQTADGEAKSATWIIEIHSQILFSASASVNFEVLVGRDERSLEYGIATGAVHGQGAPGQVQDHQQGKNRHHGRHPAQQKGVYSKAVKLVVDDTTSLWNKPALPEWEDAGEKSRTSREGHDVQPHEANKVKKQKKIHVVIVTHGLHSNLGADMLYLKESIDATVAQARKDAMRRRRAAKRKEANPSETTLTPENGESSIGSGENPNVSTAPLSGGQEDIDEDEAEEYDSDDEEVVVRGFSDNAVRTERGIQYLGKRLAKYILDLTYPDQPFLPVKKSMKKQLSGTFSSKPKDVDEGIPAHSGSSVHHTDHGSEPRAYKYTSISFVGHSLGGLVQTYAIAYIHKHSPEFFEKIKPINFICLASPLLGLSNENPMYVKFALDFGLVGRTGQDLGLTWRAPTLARGGWAAMVSGFGGGQKDQKQEDPGAKPLLRILPTGPAHQVLRMFRNRTVYSNVVNDGIVPLRTSCLLFLDWRGLGRVEKARRENGLVGTLASWGFAELTGQNSSPNPSRLAIPEGNQNDDSGASTPIGEGPATIVPQPSEDAVNQDETAQATSEPQSHQFLSEQQRQAVQEATSSKRTNTSNSTVNTNPFTGFINYLKGATTTPKDRKMYKRSQTIKAMQNDDHASASSSQEEHHGRPPASRGDSILEDPHNAPPKTTIFESAGDILNPPIPPTSWIIDPSTRARTIFHDRVYHPEDIPPPPVKRPSRLTRSFSSEHSVASVSTTESGEPGGMRVEEKIARSYHKDLSWRKVLVRLEPDAHNNIVVRRMFANAYGWPVIKHLCDTHFADTYAARTRDENEPAKDRAKGMNTDFSENGEEVEGQRSKAAPKRSASEMREATDELAPLREAAAVGGSDAAVVPKLLRQDSSLWDDVYFEGSDESDNEDERGYIQRFLSPMPKSRRKPDDYYEEGEQHHPGHSRTKSGTSEAEIAAFLTASPPPLEGHRGLSPTLAAPAPTPSVSALPPLPSSTGATQDGSSTATAAGGSASIGSTSELGLRKSVEEQLGSPTVTGTSPTATAPAPASGAGVGASADASARPGSSGTAGSVSEQVAKLSASHPHPQPHEQHEPEREGEGA